METTPKITQSDWSSREMAQAPADKKWKRWMAFTKAKLALFAWGKRHPEKALEVAAQALWQVCAGTALVGIPEDFELRVPQKFIDTTTDDFVTAYKAFEQDEPFFRKVELNCDKDVLARSYLNSEGRVSLSQVTVHFSAQAIIIWVLVTYAFLREEERDEELGLANVRLVKSNVGEWLRYVTESLTLLEKSKFA